MTQSGKRKISMTHTLDDHPIFNSINTIEQLRTFMEHHVFAVWDFMCLAKALQRHVAPCPVVWIPPNNQNARLINEIILGEESDVFEGKHMSHFEMYVKAMEEVGADTTTIKHFIESLSIVGLEESIKIVPPLCADFMHSTFDFIVCDRPHIIAAAFCNGRETIIPSMFKKFLANSKVEAPTFEYYLKRHIEVDGNSHGPASTAMVDNLCTTSQHRYEADEASERAIAARVKFWDDIMKNL